MLDTILYSSIAAFVTRLIVHPLDTIKTRVQNGTTEQSRSIISVLRSTKHLGSLYNGISVTLALSVPGLAVYLSTYELAKRNVGLAFSRDGVTPANNVFVHALAGTAAECLSGFLWTPMEVMKSKLQVETTATGGTSATMDLAKRIYREEGMRGFFRGYFITLGVFIPQTVIYFVAYEQLKSYSLTQPIPHFVGYLGSAAIASTLSSSISNVLDVVKTRIQVANDPQYNRMWNVAVDMYRNEGGVSAFTRGVTARVVSIVPSSMLSMTIFEVLKDLARRREKGKIHGY
ncbi:mitochondrial carrier [Rhizoclosmatium globosum]|uniref:Mitochondrial carrier n=1 Tax=Rhizoclosmatium globosum TaxID=329046 RepID=A0A1Y2D1T1_9FUNG|nr:mitochondrial carrier [Rhizoclosmatium globosum]|eukprot:ORY53238.1 mitochondrial carrier [Rhizoclosmatium globosum]